jgi:hypothetical protein
MATEPLGAESALLNMPSQIESTMARDAEFWRLHAERLANREMFGVAANYAEDKNLLTNTIARLSYRKFP